MCGHFMGGSGGHFFGWVGVGGGIFWMGAGEWG